MECSMECSWQARKERSLRYPRQKRYIEFVQAVPLEDEIKVGLVESDEAPKGVAQG